MTEQTIFLTALDIPDAAKRTAYLDTACAGDAALRRQVEALLGAHERSGLFLDDPAVVQMAAARPAPGPETVTVDAGATTHRDEDLGFLQPPTRPGSLGRLAHYEVLEVLGRGGFGTVLRAFDDRLHRMVAIKVLAPQLATSGTARSRFRREAKSGAAVRDDHVVHIYAVADEDEPIPYLVMEYIAGQTLQQKLDRTGPLPVHEILRIGQQVARGLAAAHATGLIHRDVKPSNILLENGVERVKLTDFGLARAADDASISHSGVVAGTPMYMSPEQAQGGQIDHRADLFSLGSVLYAMCTGRPPFRATTTMAVLKRVCEANPRPIRDINPEVPEWLESIIAKLHAKSPSERFQSATQVADLLAQHLAHLQQPQLVRQPDPVALPRTEPTRRAEQVGTLLVGLVIVALVAGFLVSAAESLVRYGGLWVAGALLCIGVVIELVTRLAPRFSTQRAGILHPTSGVLLLLAIPGSVFAVLLSYVERVEFELPLVFAGLLVLMGVLIALLFFVLSRRPASARQPSSLSPLRSVTAGIGGRGRLAAACVGVVLLSGIAVIIALNSRLFPPDNLIVEWEDPGLQVQIAGTDSRNRNRTITGGAPNTLRLTTRLDPGTYKLVATKDGAEVYSKLLIVRRAWSSTEHITERAAVTFEFSNPEIAITVDGVEWHYPVRGNVRQVTRGIRYGRHNWVVTDLSGQRIDGGEFILASGESKHVWISGSGRNDGFTPLFNGRDLTGWETRPGDRGKWLIEDGSLAGTSNQPSHLFTIGGDYENFHLRVQVRGDGRMGIGFRCPKELHLGGVFPMGYRMWVDPFEEGVSTLYSYPGEHLLHKSEPNAKRPDGWVTVEIIAQGSRIKTFVNGTKSADVTDTEFRRGHIAVTADEGVFRRIEIKELAPPPPEEDGWLSLFNGADLSGWSGKFPDAWSVENGVLFGRGKKGSPDGWSELIHSRANFQDLHLRAEARINAAGWASIRVRKQKASLNGYKIWLSNDPATTGARTGRLDAVGGDDNLKITNPSDDLRLPVNEWFRLEFIARGPELQVLLNGKEVARTSDASFARGEIQLEVAGADTVVQFRKIEIKEPPPSPPAGTPLDREDLTKLRGEWKAHFAEYEGKLIPSQQVDELSINLGDGNFEFRNAGKRHEHWFGTYRVEAEKKHLLLYFQGQTVPVRCPYRLSGDRLGLDFAGLPDDAAAATRENPLRVQERLRSQNNLAQLAMAMINFSSEHKAFPPAAISNQKAKDGKPLLSWRIAILPYLEANDLYKEFKLDEPWDSEHNKKLIPRMPKVFEAAGIKAPELGMTHYRVFVGPGTAFERRPDREHGFAPSEIADGTSNTLLMAEAADPVIWTRPDDLEFDPKKPLPKLGVNDRATHIVYCDGKVVALAPNVSDDILRGLITRNGGESVSAPVLMPAPQPFPPLYLELQRADFVSLFNGKELTGWKTYPDNTAGFWTVRDNLLEAKVPDGKDSSHLVWTGREYLDFHLRAEVRLGDGAFGGIRFRWDYPKLTPSGTPDAWLAVFNHNSPIKTRTGSLLQLGANKAMKDRLVMPDVWFTYEVIAQGDEIEVKVNGQTTVKHTDSQRLFRGGRLALEIASPGDIIQFRKIEIKELPPATRSQLVKLRTFTPGKDALPRPHRGPNSEVTVVGDSCRIENSSNTGSVNVMVAQALDGLPKDGVLVFRAKVKVEAKHKNARGDLGIGGADGVFESWGQWPAVRSRYDGNDSDWTEKEVRYPAAQIKTNPPTVYLYAGLHANGVLWLKDVELLHLPAAPAPAGAPAGSNSIKLQTFPAGRTTVTRIGVRKEVDSYRIENQEPREVYLFNENIAKLPRVTVDGGVLRLRAQVKCEGLVGRARLRLNARWADGGTLVSDTGDEVSGTSDWVWRQVRLPLKPGQRPDYADLKLFIDGKGTVWFRDLELLYDLPEMSAERIKAFTTRDVPLTPDAPGDNRNGWRIEARSDRTAPLFEVADLPAGPGVLRWRAKMKTDAVDGGASLEAVGSIDGVKVDTAKSAGSGSGTKDWAYYEVAMPLMDDKPVTKTTLNVVIKGKGTVWVKDVELLRFDPDSHAAQKQADAAKKPGDKK